MRFSFKSLVVKLGLLCVLTMSANVGQAMAENYYVASDNGNDGNRGTLQAPFKTLERGVSVLLPGDTLYVRGGTYQGFYFSLKIPSGNSWSQPVTIKAYQQEKVVISPPHGLNTIHFKNGSEYIILDGFTMDAKRMGAGIGTGQNSHHIRIMNGEVMNSATQGIITNPGSHHFEFINLRIHDNGSDPFFHHGMYITTNNHLVKDCSIYRNATRGIQIYSGIGPKAQANRIDSNKIYENGRKGYTGGIGVAIGQASGNIIKNNIIWGNNGYGISVNYASGNYILNNTIYKQAGGISLGARGNNSKVINNIVSSNFHYGVVVSKGSYSNQITNNLLHGGTGRELINWGTGTILSKNLVGSNYNPNFQDAGNLNFRITSGSPAIDGGLELSEVDKDFDSNSRPKASSHDIGAFEKS